MLASDFLQYGTLGLGLAQNVKQACCDAGGDPSANVIGSLEETQSTVRKRMAFNPAGGNKRVKVKHITTRHNFQSDSKRSGDQVR